MIIIMIVCLVLCKLLLLILFTSDYMLLCVFYILNNLQTNRQITMQKIQYQINSPFIELLESKKKVYGHKYDVKNPKSQWKTSPASTSLFSHTKKQFKSESSQKRALKTQVQKKKRINTEHGEDKLHQSLCVHLNTQDRQNHHATKSLFYGQFGKYKDESDETVNKWANAFRKQSKNKNIQIKQHIENNLDNLSINDIDSLLSLIDNCIMEANQYISYLSDKLQSTKQQLLSSRATHIQLQQSIKMKNVENQQKNKMIQVLQKQINSIKDNYQQPFELKKLLEVIQKLNDQNQKLRNIIDIMKKNQTKDNTNAKDKQDVYKQINSRIDILNISIDKKKNHSASPGSKKYKYIKTKVK